MSSGLKDSPSLSEVHLLMCPRSGLSRQRSHCSAEQQLLTGIETTSSDGPELAQVCIQLCCCLVSP